MTLFLTADGKPIYGGTYFPPEDKDAAEGDTIPGLKTLIKAVKKFRDEQPKEFQEQADDVANERRSCWPACRAAAGLVGLDRDLVGGAVDALKDQFDHTHGGFGSAARGFRGPKFPMPPSLLLLQHEAVRNRRGGVTPPLPDEMVAITLDHMARGGIYDHIGGGFHRYSTERTWTVPHFEKMLYDNAQLLEVYAAAYQSTKKPADERVLRQTLGFVDREMTAPEGGFYSALDADADGEEGRFYVWTDAEIDAVLGNKDDAALFKQVYGADGDPNFESKYRILRSARVAGGSGEGTQDDGGGAGGAAGPAAAEAVRGAGEAAAAVPRYENPDGVERRDDRRPGGGRAWRWATRSRLKRRPAPPTSCSRTCGPRTADCCGPTARAGPEAGGPAHGLSRRLCLSRSRSADAARRDRRQALAGRGEGADRRDDPVPRATRTPAVSSTRPTTPRNCSPAPRTSTTAPSRAATASPPGTWCGCG